jgi:hypothetical protein
MVQFGQLISSTIRYDLSSKCCRAPCSSPIDAQKLANIGTATSRKEHADEIWTADDVVSPTGLAVRGCREGLERVNRVYMIVKSEEQCENYCLTKEITKESEMADAKGSTATGAPL